MAEEVAVYWRKPDGVIRGYVPSFFGQLHFRQAGSADSVGIPLIMFHQSPSSGRPFESLLAALGQDRLALAVDTPGFGDSDAPSAPPTIAEYAHVMRDFLDMRELEQVDLFGDHTGAKIAVELARQIPGRVRRLILNSCPVYSEAQMATMMEHLEKEKPKADQPLNDTLLVERWTSLRQWYGKAPISLVARDFAEMQRSLDLGWYGHNAAFKVNHADNLPHVPHPILVLCPRDMLWDATKACEPYLKNGRILELEDYGMGSLSTNADVYANIFREFLDGPASEPTNLPVPLSAPKVNINKAREVRRGFANTPAGQVHYRIAGEGKLERRSVVCLHMSPVSSRNFEALLIELSQDRSAVAFDIPGFGESDAPMSKPSIEDLAGTIILALDEVGLSPQIDLVGDHTGAVIAAEIAASYPELVCRLALNTLPSFNEKERKERLSGVTGDFWSEDGAHLRKRWASINKISGPGYTAELINRNFVESLRGGPFSHWGHGAVFAYDLNATLPKVIQPTLVYRPRDGLESNTQRAFSLLQAGTLYDLPYDQYGFMELRAPEVAAELTNFFDAI